MRSFLSDCGKNEYVNWEEKNKVVLPDNGRYENGKNDSGEDTAGKKKIAERCNEYQFIEWWEKSLNM